MRYFDLHCDTMLTCQHKNIPLKENDLHVSMKKAEPMEHFTQCYAVFLHDSLRGEKAVECFNNVADRLAYEVEQNRDVLTFCKQPGDLAGLSRHGAILTVESAAALGGNIENIADWVRRGVKMCTLTWSGENELGRGVLTEGTTGLTDFGREVVREFEKNGILVDISHASPELFWDVAELAARPLVASHSNAKEICAHPRNLTDEQFAAIVKSDGLVGLNFYDAFLNDTPENASMEDILRHAEHFLERGGENHLAMGGDMDGSTMPKDLQDGLAGIPRLYELFLRHYSQTVTDKIFYDNAAGFFAKYAAL